MADEQSTEQPQDSAPAELPPLTNEQLLAAANELFGDSAEIKKHLAEIVRINEERDEQKREALLEELRQKDPAALQGEVPTLADLPDEESFEIDEDEVAEWAEGIEGGEGAETVEAAEGAAPAAPEEGGLPPPPGARWFSARRRRAARPAGAPPAKRTVQLTKAQQMAIAMVVADILGLIIGLVGLRVSNRKLAEAVAAKTAKGWMYGVRNIGRELTNARNAKNWGRCAAICGSIFVGLCKVTSVKSVVTLVFGTMTVADWIKSGVLVMAQLGLWFGTAGVAMVAQLVTLMAGATDLIRDSITLAKVMEK